MPKTPPRSTPPRTLAPVPITVSPGKRFVPPKTRVIKEGEVKLLATGGAPIDVYTWVGAPDPTNGARTVFVGQGSKVAATVGGTIYKLRPEITPGSILTLSANEDGDEDFSHDDAGPAGGQRKGVTRPGPFVGVNGQINVGSGGGGLGDEGDAAPAPKPAPERTPAKKPARRGS